MSSGKIKQTFIMDFDDFAPTTTGVDKLLMMKEHYPNFRCTCFTPAFSEHILSSKIGYDKFKAWADLIKQWDWIEVAPHGFMHLKNECMTRNRKESLIVIKAIENVLKDAKIKYVKIFKAPHWRLSKEMEKILHERGYTVAIDRNNPVSYTSAPKYVWNWSIDEPVPTYHTIKGHGHMHGTNNGIDTCLPNLLKIPTDAEFLTIGEYLNL